MLSYYENQYEINLVNAVKINVEVSVIEESQRCYKLCGFYAVMNCNLWLASISNLASTGAGSSYKYKLHDDIERLRRDLFFELMRLMTTSIIT